MPTDNQDPLSILTAAHEARRMAYYANAGGLEIAMAVLADSTDTRAPAAHAAVLDARAILFESHCRATKQEDDSVRALLRPEASTAAFLESGAPDGR